MRSVFWLFTAAVLLVATGLALGGALLASAGGSPGYLLEGALLLTAGVFLVRRSEKAVWLIVVYWTVNLIWALVEVGLDGWALLPRLDVAVPLMILAATPVIRGRMVSTTRTQASWTNRALLGALSTLALVLAAAALVGVWPPSAPRVLAQAPLPGAAGDTQWTAIGHDPSGARFSPLSDLGPQNVGRLRRIWDYRDDELVKTPSAHRFANRDEATPLEVNGRLFICLADDSVLALDAETGRRLWRHNPHVDKTGLNVGICRGVAYGEIKASKVCPRRLLIGTIDARLLAINAETGEPCTDFGDKGAVSLKAGLGDVKPGLYYDTSPPTLAGGLLIVGALVKDGQSTDEPSGVIRAFSALTGKRVWAWDAGRLYGPSGPEPTYTRGTPNAWSFFSVDERLGLVYIPTGNAGPDYVARHRNPAWEPYSSAVVALDIASGRLRWSFQTTHHDLWDYDAPAQPVLFDWPTPKGTIPAVVQPTKRGELFVLDRRTGAPLSDVRELPAPRTDVPGEWTAKTQPWSMGMPHLGGPALKESDMWGITPFDQIACRLAFRRLRYDGPMTPPSLKGSLVSPGEAGGQNWGSVTVDGRRGLLIAPTLRLAYVVRLESHNTPASARDLNPQIGTPYRAFYDPFLSVMGAPCQRPPYALVSAVDLRTGKLAWERPLGRADQLGPHGLKSHLPLTLGAPPIIGGAVTTAGGLVFIGAVGDKRLYALDVATGRVVWSDRLPAGNQATPITYRAPRSGRQMVVMVSGGSIGLKIDDIGPTHVVAYALPAPAKN